VIAFAVDVRGDIQANQPRSGWAAGHSPVEYLQRSILQKEARINDTIPVDRVLATYVGKNEGSLTTKLGRGAFSDLWHIWNSFCWK